MLLALAGCSVFDDDSGTPCSELPESAELDAPAIFVADGAATAVGGDETFATTIVDGCGDPRPGARLTRVTADASIFTATVGTADVTLHAHAAGSTLIAFYEGDEEVADLVQAAKVLDHVQLGSHEDGVPAAFLVGAPIAAVNLFAADGQPVIDSSIAITGAPRAINLNEVAIDGLAVGDHPLAITAAGQSWSAVVHVVGTIDEVVARAPSVTLAVGQPGRVCFDARLAGEIVAGAPWQFAFPAMNGDAGGRPNCVDVRSDTPTSFTVTATALGKSTATLVTFQ
jgi:hypothetical protein